LMIWIASNGHFFTQIPHPTQSTSEITDTFDLDVTSTQPILPMRTTGQDLLHSRLHRFGLHRSPSTIAIRVNLSAIAPLMDCRRAGKKPDPVVFTASAANILLSLAQPESYRVLNGCRKKGLGAASLRVTSLLAHLRASGIHMIPHRRQCCWVALIGMLTVSNFVN
jgi:hypothetical protein